MGAGRQRSFDKQQALNRAMDVFWRKGYSGASLSDLTGAMGINKPSLYAAFGNKESLFVNALHHYLNLHGVAHARALLAPGADLDDRLRAYLRSVARMVTDPELPGGCFLATSTCEAGGQCLPADAMQAVADINAATKKWLVDFMNAEQAKGNIAVDQSPDVLADYLLTLQFGLAVMARDGASRKTLDLVIDHAIA